jgi:hypothetical protein
MLVQFRLLHLCIGTVFVPMDSALDILIGDSDVVFIIIKDAVKCVESFHNVSFISIPELYVRNLLILNLAYSILSLL